MKILLSLIILVTSNTTFGQNSLTLKECLQNKYSENSTDGQWIFHSEKADIEKLDKPLVRQLLSNYAFYAVNLTYKIRPDLVYRCIVFFDSTNQTFILHEPLSMNGINPKLISLIKDKPFNDSSSLFNFIKEFHNLRQIGSKYKFILTKATDSLLSYDIVFFSDQDYINKPYSETSANNYKSTEIMGKFYVKIDGNKIKDYIELSPKSKY